MARKAQTKKDAKITMLEDHLRNNSLAIEEGPKRKSYSIHDLKTIKPITYPQKSMFESYMNGNHIAAIGSAGTGKTLCALFLALNDLFNKDSKIEKIHIVRSSVSVRDIGFQPGDTAEKMEPYEAAYVDICSILLGPNSYDIMKETGKLKFIPTSFCRGLTWDNTVVIVEESQSMNFHELNTVITRLGNNSKLIAIGDTMQNDLIYRKNDESGLPKLIKIFERMDEVDIIEFTKHDIVRSGFVKAFLMAHEDFLDSFD